MNNFDNKCTHEIICPHCGYEHSDSYELLNDNKDCGETDCEECGKTFRWSSDFTITFSTEKMEE